MTSTNAHNDAELEEKKLYAAALIREPDPFKAALSLFKNNTNRALKAAHFWPDDPDVLAEIQRLKNDVGETNLLPNKADLARAVWQRMQGVEYGEMRVPIETDDYAKLAKLYGEIMGFIEKPGTNINVNAVIPKAISVPTFESDEEWAKIAEQQQRELLNVSRTKH